jgi:squalene cyclase
VERARNWLIETEPKHQEDRAFRMLGLVWTEAARDQIEKATLEIIEQQRDDGGWAQEAGMESDAYATGQILVALLKADALKAHPQAIGSGIEYLQKTKLDDGSWFVQTRSRPIQKYFESGFPHEKSQFISICGTCWAALAMLQSP